MKRKFFTLTELMVVIAIIVILAGMLIGGAGYAGRRADEAAARTAISNLTTALEAFRAQNGYYPLCSEKKEVSFKIPETGTNKGNLMLVLGTSEKEFFDKKTDAKKGFIDMQVTVSDTVLTDYLDPWGNPFIYMCPGKNNPNSFDLWSKGPNGKDSTGEESVDDVTNWIRTE